MTTPELLLIRGPPGSGKTTMAKEYAEAGYVHCEADQYFETDGEYRYDPSKLRAAHDDCLRRGIGAFPCTYPLETNMPEIRVNIHTLAEMGSCYDWAAFRTEDVKEIVHRFFEGGKNLGATFVEVFDCTPDFHFLEDTRIDCVRLVVSCHDGDFWWEGYYRHCPARFQTHRLQLKDLDITKDTDMRINVETA